MKLTNTIRDAFISQALHDVPKKDFKEEGQKIIMKAAIRNLPPRVKALYDDSSTRHFVVTHYFNYNSIPLPNAIIRNYNHPLNMVIGSMVVPGPAENSVKFDKEEIEALVNMYKESQEQETKLQLLRVKLRGVAYSTTTRKALADLLPEFAKYLPAEIPVGSSSKNLPAVTDVLSEFVRAGWPVSRETT